jgi:hypothetical protein
MGMYLDAMAVYGLAFDRMPAMAWEDENGEDIEPPEDGEPVFGGRLVWGSNGHTCGSEPGCYLAVVDAPSGRIAAHYAVAVPKCSPLDEAVWSTWALDYCREVGIRLADGQEPGWLALASFG